MSEHIPAFWEEDSASEGVLAEALVEEALLKGAREAEAYLKASATTGILLNSRYATLSGGVERGIGLRVFDVEGNVGHAVSSRVEGSRGTEVVLTAVGAMRAAAEAGCRAEPGLTAPRPDSPLLKPEGMVDPRVGEWSPEQKREMVEAALGEASWGRPGAASAAYRDGVSRVTLVNSRGFSGSYARTLTMVTLTRAGETGPTLHSEWVAPGPDREQVMETAAALARLQPGGEDEEIDPDDLLLAPSAAITLLRRLTRSLVLNSRDAPEDAPSPRVASDAVTVVDDGLMPGGIATAPFDGEGVATGRLTLVKAGLRIDRLRRPRPGEIGRPGSSVRPSYRDLPAPGGTNLFIVPGRRTSAEILSGIDRGFALEVLESDARDGSGSRGGSRWRGIGWEVREGGVVGPCRRILFRAQAGELLEGILEASDRLRFSLRRGVALGTPDLLIRRRR